MRSVPLVAALLLTTVVGCGVEPAPRSAGADATSSASPSAPAPSPSAETAPSLPVVPDDDPLPCPRVRAGIDAFNQGAPERTVRLFRGAVPQAERYAADVPSRTADLLLEAVRYYADLPAEDYADAIVSSPEFRRHQVVTLAVCRYGQDDSPGATDDAVPA